MTITVPPEFHLRQIAESGQCFRWRAVGADEYVVPAFGSLLHLRCRGEMLELDCTPAEYKSLWHDYLDLGRDYGAICARIPSEDTYLTAAAKAQKGIRILRQEPWETLVTFTISQRKTIPAIKTAVEKLCQRAGKPIGTIKGETVHAFPTARELSELGEEELRACSLGYRAPYLFDTAQRFALGLAGIKTMEGLGDEELFSALCSLKGVGKKIALCTMLFGFSRSNAFPVDVWMERVLADKYPAGFDYERYYPYNGIMQQYLFAHYRAEHGR